MKQVNEIIFSYLLNFGSIHLLHHQRKCWYQLQWDLSWFSDLSMTLLSYPMGYSGIIVTGFCEWRQIVIPKKVLQARTRPKKIHLPRSWCTRGPFFLCVKISSTKKSHLKISQPQKKSSDHKFQPQKRASHIPVTTIIPEYPHWVSYFTCCYWELPYKTPSFTLGVKG